MVCGNSFTDAGSSRRVKSSREKRRARKTQNAARFAELERETAERIRRLDPEMSMVEQGRGNNQAQASPEVSGERVGGRGQRREDAVGGMSGGREERWQRPPEYESLMREDERRGRRRSRAFWRRGNKAGEGVGR